jgi:thiamine-phosphate pyrophosphorylase
VIPAGRDGGARLYPIVDVDALAKSGIDVLAFAQRVLVVQPRYLQLRAKNSGARDVLALLRALKPLCEEQRVPLFANDRPDLAVLAEANGVHLGQDDLPVAEVRRFAPGLRVGVSTHNLEQLDAALRLEPDYVAFGPVFGTSSKARPDPTVGLEGLHLAAEKARAAGVPLVAIGGIDTERAPAIAKTGAIAAVIAALIPRDGALDRVADTARALERALS